MEMEGRVWRDGKFWMVEVPAIDAMTQGKTRKQALAMIKELVEDMAQVYFERDFEVLVSEYQKGVIGVTANDNKLLLALSLRRQRDKSGSTVREASERLGSKSPNAYAQYEKGKINISLDKYEALLIAANPSEPRRLRIL